jgi:hypothetical protein
MQKMMEPFCFYIDAGNPFKFMRKKRIDEIQCINILKVIWLLLVPRRRPKFVKEIAMRMPFMKRDMLLSLD